MVIYSCSDIQNTTIIVCIPSTQTAALSYLLVADEIIAPGVLRG